jgi:gas vesicle protein
MCTLVGGYYSLALAEDTVHKDTATNQISRGAQQVGQGITETAREVGNTVVESVKRTGETLRQAGETVVPEAQNAWEQVRDGATTMSRKVGTFLERLF